MNKKCYYCGKEKNIEKFGKDKHRKDGYRGFCKDCGKVWDKYYKAIKDLKGINHSFKANYNYERKN